MRRALLSLASIGLLACIGCGGEMIDPTANGVAEDSLTNPKPDDGLAVMNPENKSRVHGFGFFGDDNKGKITFEMYLYGLDPAVAHEAHIHQNDSCRNQGLAAGDHWDPTHPVSYTLGPLIVSPEGVGHLSISAGWTVGDKGPHDVIGHAIVVHGTAASPTARIACGLIRLAQ